jgi:hypothetical protein
MLAPQLAKVYPLYWKNELVITKGSTRIDREQESSKNLQRFLRDFNLFFLLLGQNLQTFNKLWDIALHSDSSFLGVHQLEQGNTFKFSCFLHFLVLTAHSFFQPHGLSELLEKIEFSKGTESVKAMGLRLSFISGITHESKGEDRLSSNEY